MSSNFKVGGIEIGRQLVPRHNSYADSAILDEAMPSCAPMCEQMTAGGVLFFGFDIMHRSLPALNPSRSRWTVQRPTLRTSRSAKC